MTTTKEVFDAMHRLGPCFTAELCQREPCQCAADIAADIVDGRLKDAAESALSWLERWAMHAGRCPADENCTCGLVAIRHELSSALNSLQTETA